MFVLIVAGPTAVGKSKLALELAQRLDGEILSADSRQVYRLMDIGTAKPTLAERALIPHHLIDLVYPDESFSAARYAGEFHRAVCGITKRGRLPIVTGGTGLYIRAAIRQFLFPDVGARPEIRDRLRKTADVEGAEGLHDRLASVDPEAAARIHHHDARRIIRALEVYEATGEPISRLQRERGRGSLYDGVYICLTRPRDELYRRIDARADRMMAEGFLDEVDSLLGVGYDRSLPTMKGLGYRELAAHIKGEVGLGQAVDELKQRTRNYAKRQLTWFRHEQDVVWLDCAQMNSHAIMNEIMRLAAGRRRVPSK